MAEIRHKKSRGVLLRTETEELTRSDLSGLNLPGADLRGASLCGAHLRGANLTGADLSGADLTGADLRDAILAEADLCGADLRDVQLAGADLTRVRHSHATRWPTGLLPAGAGALLVDDEAQVDEALASEAAVVGGG